MMKEVETNNSGMLSTPLSIFNMSEVSGGSKKGDTLKDHVAEFS